MSTTVDHSHPGGAVQAPGPWGTDPQQHDLSVAGGRSSSTVSRQRGRTRHVVVGRGNRSSRWPG